MSRRKRFLRVFVLVLVIAGLCAAYYSWRIAALSERYEAAVTLYHQKSYRDAASSLQGVYHMRPSSAVGANALYYYCRSLDALGEGGESAKAWRELLANPVARAFHPQAVLALARADIDGNRLDAAAGALDTFLGANSQSPLIAEAKLMRAELLEKKGDISGALLAVQKVVEEYPESAVAGQARKKMGDLYIALLFSGQGEGTEEYRVRRGDSLQAIAKRFGTTVELIKEMNKGTIKGNSLRPNDRLKVCTTEFSIVADKSANTLSLKAGDRVVKVYSVGTGKQGSTPVGEFSIINKISEPDWFKPGGKTVPFGDPENVLGTRWMGIDSPTYGIHGTWQPDTIGKQASAGCIRMLNKEVEELYTIVPMGTQVRIVERSEPARDGEPVSIRIIE
ncbi:MAG: L,D-transpeptidase family protein [Candidatus Aureabacteria bacterium]|nr:L,D-transpeptidase family protein [Candidatus Auribacterota bacterium]